MTGLQRRLAATEAQEKLRRELERPAKRPMDWRRDNDELIADSLKRLGKRLQAERKKLTDDA